MFLAVFHQNGQRVFHGRRANWSAFGHAFGGSADYAGLAADDGQPPAHLLLRLNTADPAVGVSLPQAGWLPLLCAIRFGACDLGYRVVSDSEVQFLHRAEARAWSGFPAPSYPDRLPSSPLVLEEEEACDPGDPESVLRYAGVFGYEALTAGQFAALVCHVESEVLPDNPFDWASGEEYLRVGHCSPFPQGRPREGCPDAGCGNHDRAGLLRTISVFQEGWADARSLWGPDGGNLQIIHQICPTCSAIRVTNQAT